MHRLATGAVACGAAVASGALAWPHAAALTSQVDGPLPPLGALAMTYLLARGVGGVAFLTTRGALRRLERRKLHPGLGGQEGPCPRGKTS